MGFHHVGQAGLELLTSGNPPAFASHSPGITGVSHCAWPCVAFSKCVCIFAAYMLPFFSFRQLENIFLFITNIFLFSKPAIY